MIDAEGYRPNVGIVLINGKRQVFWGRRCHRDGWQFPQGGIRTNEVPEAALFRELHEEVGLDQSHVRVLGRTRDWLYYDLPESLRRSAPGRQFPDRQSPDRKFRGQKQIWFLLEFLGVDDCVNLGCCDRPEFDAWRWVDYWQPLDEIVSFKRDVYRRALSELEALATRCGVAPGRASTRPPD